MTPFAPIFGLTPADLQNMGMTSFLLRGPEPNLNTPASCSSAPFVCSVSKSGSRSKIARLPKSIQHNLNTMLARGCAYRDIIRILNAQGFPGFNKVNLNAWKNTGHQDWLRSQHADPSSEGDQTAVEAHSNG